MSRSGISPMIPLLFSNLNHSTPEWLENRINRATFAATGYASMILILSEHQDALDKDSLGNLIGQSIGMDTVYILRIGRTVGALYISDSEGLLIKYTPSTNEASFEKLVITNHGETQTNEILESMILKGTIDAYYHVEYEEFLVMSDMINQSIQNGSVDEEEDEECKDHDDKEADDDDEYEEESEETPEEYNYSDFEDINDIARSNGFSIDDDGHWVPLEDDFY